MVRPSVIVVLVFLVLLQATLTTGWGRQRRKPKTCSYPRPSKCSPSNYFYGSTKLQKSSGKRSIVGVYSFKHSLLMFRGKIFEWGLGSPRTYKMDRNPTDCAIKWDFSSLGWSGCLLSDIENWTRDYRRRHGSYHLFSNNCHHFVNGLGGYLKTNCGCGATSILDTGL